MIAEAPESPLDSGDKKLLSFVEWDTDTTFSNLNQTLSETQITSNDSIPLERAVNLLGHKNPKLRILELGNGSNDITLIVLKALTLQHGERLYSSYTYAATSPEASEKADEVFKKTNKVEVTYFDAGRSSHSQTTKAGAYDLMSQAGAYDLIITTDFFSPERDLRSCIDQLKTLIHPLGHIVTLDALREQDWSLFVKNYLRDTSATASSASRSEDFVSRVHARLAENDFEFESKGELQSSDLRVFAQLKKPLQNTQKVSLVVPDDFHPLVNAVQNSFEDAGIECDIRTFEEKIPAGNVVISLVDFGEPYIYNFTEGRFRETVKFLSSFKGSIIWVTPIAQIASEDPNSSMIIGLTRTLRAELRKDITVVEVDAGYNPHDHSGQALLKIYQGLTNRQKSKDVDPDYEYTIIDEEVKIPRLHWTSLGEELPNSGESVSGRQNSTASDGETSAPVTFRNDACYLLVGGIGGLGRAIARWMVENGARNIMFFSRSAKEGPETTPFFNELRDQGCEVSTFAGSVTSKRDVAAAVKKATKPIAGLMQMSAVMRDNWMSQMTFDEWEQSVGPKVQGTWNLHEMVPSDNLDFFIAFSSICGITGQWGQANYNASNSFLDAFTQYRQGLGMAASVVDIGFMGEVGMAVENDALVKKLKTGGYYFLGVQDLLDALAVAIANSRPGKDRFLNKGQLILGLRSTKPMTAPSCRVVWKKDARMAVSHAFDGATPPSS